MSSREFYQSVIDWFYPAFPILPYVGIPVAIICIVWAIKGRFLGAFSYVIGTITYYWGFFFSTTRSALILPMLFDYDISRDMSNDNIFHELSFFYFAAVSLVAAYIALEDRPSSGVQLAAVLTPLVAEFVFWVSGILLLIISEIVGFFSAGEPNPELAGFLLVMLAYGGAAAPSGVSILVIIPKD